MKRAVLFLLCLGLANLGFAISDPVAEGRAAIVARDFATARAKFTEALAADPANQTAGALRGLIGMFNVVGDPGTQSFLDSLGISEEGRDPFNWSAMPPVGEDDNLILPEGFNFSAFAVYFRDVLVPASAQARADLALVTSEEFTLTLSAEELGSVFPLTVDFGDIQLARAFLHAFEFSLHFLNGQNTDADLASVAAMMMGDTGSFARLLSENPNLLTVGPAEQRAAAKTSLAGFIARYRTGSTFILNRPEGLERLFVLEGTEFEEESIFRAFLDKIELSLTGPTQLLPDTGDARFFLGALFEPTLSLRGLLPDADRNGLYNPFKPTDPTVGGLLENFPGDVLRDLHQDLGFAPDLDWQWANPSPVGHLLQGHAGGNGVRVIVGARGILTSSDGGVSWTPRRIPGDPVLRSVIFNFTHGQFVAVGNGAILTSSDGIEWTRRNDRGFNLTSVATNGPIYLATTGQQGAFLRSTDGVDWSPVQLGFISSYFQLFVGNSILFDPASGHFVAVGDNPYGYRILKSPDGLSWTGLYTGGTALHAIASNGNGASPLYVAVGSNNVVVSASSLTGVWTSGSSSAGAHYRSVIWTGTTFAATKVSTTAPTSTITTSSTGVPGTWTDLSTHAIPSLSVFRAGTRLVATGDGGRILESTAQDGTGFAAPAGYTVQDAVSSTFVNFPGLKKANGILFALGTKGALLSSADGVTFTPQNTGRANILRSIAHHDGTYVIVGDANFGNASEYTALLTSPDGITWTPQTVPVALASLMQVQHLGGQWVAVGSDVTSSGTGLILTSADGVNWSEALNGGFSLGTTLLAVAHGNGQYVAVGMSSNQAEVATSVDGSSWTVEYTGELPRFTDVVFKDGLFIAASVGGGIFSSADGKAWYNHGHLKRVSAFSNVSLYVRHGLLLALGSDSTGRRCLYISGTGEDWIASTVPANALSLETFGNEIYVAGSSNAILRSNVNLAQSLVPVIVAQPISAVSGVGSMTTFSVIAAGEGLTYQWSRNNQEIDGATSRTLTVHGIEGSDAGAYRVTVANGSGQVTSTAATLVVLPGPAINQHPSSVIVAPNTKARLSVTVYGDDSFQYQWRRNGVAILGATDPVLTIHRVALTDAGRYDVVVTGSYGTITSAPAELRVDAGSVTTQIYSGTLGNGGFYALYVRSGGLATMVGSLPGSRGNFVLKFPVAANGTFTATLNVTAPYYYYDQALRPDAMMADGRGIVFAGEIVNGQVVGRISTTGELITGQLQPSAGTTAGVSGLYEAPTVNTSSGGTTYTIVGNDGSVITAAQTGGQTVVATGTVAPNGSFTVPIGGPGVIVGNIDASSGSLTGQLINGESIESFIQGIAETSVRTDRLIGLSTRGYVGSGESVLIAGFAISGSAPKPVLIRAVGPTLGSLGVNGALNDPNLRIYRDGEEILFNDNWGTALDADQLPALAARLGEFPLPPGSRDAVVSATLPPGNYTAHVNGANGATGVALVEVYDASENPAAEPQRMTGISTRGEVRAGEGLLIAGFVVTGNAPKRVILRAVGPSLRDHGVAGVLADPKLQLFRGGDQIAANDNWSAADAEIVRAAAAQAGEFPLPEGSLDAALVITLAPGAYTAHVTGADGGTGVALVEIYELP